MIAGIDKGLIVNRFSGGQPSSNGDFSGVAKNSFLIEDGKVSSAVSETMISGNIIDMLNNIVAISKEQTTDGLLSCHGLNSTESRYLANKKKFPAAFMYFKPQDTHNDTGSRS